VHYIIETVILNVSQYDHCSKKNKNQTTCRWGKIRIIACCLHPPFIASSIILLSTFPAPQSVSEWASERVSEWVCVGVCMYTYVRVLHRRFFLTSCWDLPNYYWWISLRLKASSSTGHRKVGAVITTLCKFECVITVFERLKAVYRANVQCLQIWYVMQSRTTYYRLLC
jgi:hypothetical protein